MKAKVLRSPSPKKICRLDPLWQCLQGMIPWRHLFRGFFSLKSWWTDANDVKLTCLETRNFHTVFAGGMAPTVTQRRNMRFRKKCGRKWENSGARVVISCKCLWFHSFAPKIAKSELWEVATSRSWKCPFAKTFPRVPVHQFCQKVSELSYVSQAAWVQARADRPSRKVWQA